MKPIIDLTGMVFSMLTVIRLSDERKHGRVSWLCKCECGNETVVAGNNLRGHTKSCGCLNKMTAVKNTKHGMRGTSEYSIWATMIQRCVTPTCAEFIRYGGRGIRICDGYRKSFQAFFNDLGYRPTGKSIDRIDNDKHYSCGHCNECMENGWEMNLRWATEKEQSRNKRSNRWFEYNGEKLIQKDWSVKLNVDNRTLAKYMKTHTISETINHYSKYNGQ